MTTYLKDFLNDIGNAIMIIISSKYRRKMQIIRELEETEKRKEEEQKERLKMSLRYGELAAALNYIRKRKDKTIIKVGIGSPIFTDNTDIELDKEIIEMIIVKEMNVIEELLSHSKTL